MISLKNKIFINNHKKQKPDLPPKSKNNRNAISILFLILKILGTIILIGISTVAIFAAIFALYVSVAIQPHLDITFEDYALEQTSYIYYDNASGESEQWSNIMSTQQRTWLDFEEIPQYMIDAATAIEDKRFYEHSGVDWYRTFGALYTMFFSDGDDSFGGSTITQQLIKNLTGDDEVTVKRKIIEIFRALEVEKNYTKEEIITWYLNVIYLGESSYGVQAAANTYFGKDAGDLSLAECACIIGITNRPTAYNPYYSEDNCKARQGLVLQAMYEQGYITYSDYTEAVNYELIFASTENEESINYIYSYYEETVITEAISALIEEKDLSEEAAKTLVYNGGLHIYSCINMEIQEKLDSIYTVLDEIPSTYGSDQQLQSAMTIQDPNTGYIVALVGSVGEKNINFGFNRATQATRPPGSSIKPLSVYGPALDTGTITVNSTYKDSPLNLNGRLWPKNDSGKWSYSSYTITTAVQRSINTIAVRVTQDLGLDTSYYYLTERLGLTTLVDEKDKNLAPLALGQMTNGVTVQEMTSAYCSIANGGTYIKAKTFFKICDSNGDVVLDNSEPKGTIAFSTQTTDTLTSLLYNAVQNGTGTNAKLSSGMAVAGKTGTTGENNDRWFCGFTPYYVAACWTGYEYPESIKLTAGGNPAAQLWNKVMTLVHEDLKVITSFEPKSNDNETAVSSANSSINITPSASSSKGKTKPSTGNNIDVEPSKEPEESEEPVTVTEISPSSDPSSHESTPYQDTTPTQESEPTVEPAPSQEAVPSQETLPSENPSSTQEPSPVETESTVSSGSQDIDTS